MNPIRLLWLAGGLASLAGGLAGIVLPLLPTVPFLLLAAYCFAKSSETLHSWLVNHRSFGPPIRNWQEHGAIPARAKQYASLSIAAAFAISVWLGVPVWALLMQAIVLFMVGMFIWTRPNR